MAYTLPIDITQIKQSAIFSDIDIQFAGFIHKLSEPKSPEIFWITLLLSHSSSEGHVCLDLKNSMNTVPSEPTLPFPKTLSSVNKITGILVTSSVVGKPGDYRPLILNDTLLYLNKFWEYETVIAQKLSTLAQDSKPISDTVLLEKLLDHYFPVEDDDINWQRIAAYIAATRRLCIITGGPGTGKTTTVVRILALLTELAQGEKKRIALAAPTGKAAARMDEAVLQAKEHLVPLDNRIDLLPSSASTIHRLLGAIPHASIFKYNPDNPLPVDIAVLDEASMIDISLMHKFLAALHPRSRLILIGDRDQLASVEAGSVLGDICAPEYLQVFSTPFQNSIQPFATLPPPKGDIRNDCSSLADCIVELKKAYRFKGPLAECSNTVKNGDSEKTFSIIQDESDNTLSWTEIPNHRQIAQTIKDDILNGWHAYLNADSIEGMFDAFNSFRMLCVLRSGPFGVEAINKKIELILAETGKLSPASKWYAKLPIMITRNDYQSQLYNGDTGIIAPDPNAEGKLKAWFPSTSKDAKQPFRVFSPSRLPAYEKAFAITVHKSQGTEFDSILLLLPDTDTPILTRELLYTGMTRARKEVHLYGKRDVFSASVGRRIDRRSGLREKLWV